MTGHLNVLTQTAGAGGFTERNVVQFLVIVLFCALVIGIADWILFVMASVGLRSVLGMTPDAAMFQEPLFPWVFQVLALLGAPAAIFGIAIGAAEVFGRGASFRHALLSALAVGVVSTAVLATLWPDRDPPEFPMRIAEIGKVVTFVIPGLACWCLVRRAFSVRKATAP